MYHLYSLCIRSEIQLFNRIIISAIHHTLDMNLRLRYFIQVGTCCTAREEPSQQSALSSKCNTCFFGPVSTFLVVIICCSIFIVSQVSRGHYQARAILYFGPIYVLFFDIICCCIVYPPDNREEERWLECTSFVL